MATTPNFSWPTPDNTDLVKNGALAIRTLGDAIDASLVDLEGGTTGQVLSKTSNTDMDFTWVDTDDANAIQNAIVDAKGDLIAASAADTPARLAVGADDLLLTAASGETTGLKYTGGWTTYTTTLGGITVGNGTTVARYQKIGKTVNFFVRFTLGSTSSLTGIAFTLPITPSQSWNTFYGLAVDPGVGSFPLYAEMDGSTCYVRAMNSAGTYVVGTNTSATIPLTWANGDWFNFTGSYEVA
jgi:hypothetical protein